jgi:hypothetical protein
MVGLGEAGNILGQSTFPSEQAHAYLHIARRLFGPFELDVTSGELRKSGTLVKLQKVESYSWIQLRSWQCKPKVITFRCDNRPNPYLLREPLSSIAEKLKPFGFIRIHRSVVVNISAVEEIQPCRQESTGCV